MLIFTRRMPSVSTVGKKRSRTASQEDDGNYDVSCCKATTAAVLAKPALVKSNTSFSSASVSRRSGSRRRCFLWPLPISPAAGDDLFLLIDTASFPVWEKSLALLLTQMVKSQVTIMKQPVVIQEREALDWNEMKRNFTIFNVIGYHHTHPRNEVQCWS